MKFINQNLNNLILIKLRKKEKTKKKVFQLKLLFNNLLKRREKVKISKGKYMF